MVPISGIRLNRLVLIAISKKSNRNSAPERKRHRRMASKSQFDHDSGTDNTSTYSSMGDRHHSRHQNSSESKSGKHHHCSASMSHQDPPKSERHHDFGKDIISTRSDVSNRHHSRHLHSSVSKSHSHHHRSRSASTSHHDPPGSTSKSKAKSVFDDSVILQDVISNQSSFQSSNRHTSPSSNIEYDGYFPNDITINIDAAPAPSDDLPQTPSTKGSIVDQIGSLGSHFTRLFSTTPNPASLDRHKTVPSAVISTTSSSRHRPPSPGITPHANLTKHNHNHRHPASHAGTAPHDIASTTDNSRRPHGHGPSPSAYSQQTEKAHNNNLDENSVAATRGL